MTAGGGPFRQSVPSIGLFLEKGTEDVPDDGHFHLRLRGETVLRTRQEREALEEYRRLREKLLPPEARRRVNPQAALQRGIAEFEANAVRSEAARRKRKSALRKGGKGGSGGVAG
jgi:hypothetical protein